MRETEAGDEAPDPTPYVRLGGESGVRALVDRFYDLMELDPQFSAIRTLHAPSLDVARDKLFLFLSGWLGGPPVYVAKYGHPQLRARHLRFPIACRERDLWLLCMRRALADVRASDEFADALMRAFFGTADWTRNRDD